MKDIPTYRLTLDLTDADIRMLAASRVRLKTDYAMLVGMILSAVMVFALLPWLRHMPPVAACVVFVPVLAGTLITMLCRKNAVEAKAAELKQTGVSYAQDNRDTI